MKHETPEYTDEQQKRKTDWEFIVQFAWLVGLLFIISLGFTE
jgi:hypothetical protein